MSEIAEMIAAFPDEPGRRGRAVGRLPDGSYALFDRPLTGAARQVGRAVTVEDGLAIAGAVLDGDSRALTWPASLHVIALAFTAAAFSKPPAAVAVDKNTGSSTP